MAKLNRKAQMEIVALAFLVAGVVTVATAGLLSTGGGAKARAEFEQNFILSAHKIGEVETFYNGLINLAARNVLASEGYNLDDFCPVVVRINESLKRKLIDETDKLVSAYADYDGVPLPHMSAGVRKGELVVVPIDSKNPADSYLKISGTPAEGLLVRERGVSISSSGYFSTEIPATIKEIKPNLRVEKIVFNDNPNFKGANAGSQVKIAATLRNSGCGEAKNFKVQLLNSSGKIAEIPYANLSGGAESSFSQFFVPNLNRTYEIKAKADAASTVSEISELDNELTAYLVVGGNNTLTAERDQKATFVRSITLDFGAERMNVSKIVISARRGGGLGCKSWAKFNFFAIDGAGRHNFLGESAELASQQTKTVTYDVAKLKVRKIWGQFSEESTDSGLSCPYLDELRATIFYTL